MHAALGLGVAVGEFTAEDHRGAFDARGFARKGVGDFDLPAARFRPALIHPHEHVRPIARLGAARTGVDAENAIAPVVRAAEKYPEFERVKFLEKLREILLEFLLDFCLRFFRLGLAQFDHHLEIFELLFRLEQRLDFAAKGIGLVDELLGLLAVVPETFRRHQVVEFAETFLRARHVKETSADGQACPRRSSTRL